MSLLLNILAAGIREAVAGTALGVQTDPAARAGWAAEIAGDLDRAAACYKQTAGSGIAWPALRGAAVALRQGRWADAATWLGCLRGADQDGQTAIAELMYATLLLAGGQQAQAQERFRTTMGRLAASSSDAEHPMPIDQNHRLPDPRELHLQTLIRRGGSYLRRGRYVRAQELFEEALGEIDILLTAHGAWALAADDEAGQVAVLEALVALAVLGDAVLRYLARARLAANVADALRRRNLRDDLAPWATGGRNIDCLLLGEVERLSAQVEQEPTNAQGHYRLALAARAVGDVARSERALRAVLAICPHHGPAAARLAAILADDGRAGEAMETLRPTVHMPQAVLADYGTLAVAARDADAIERTVTMMETSGHAPAGLRPSLAMALGLMGVLDNGLKETLQENAEVG